MKTSVIVVTLNRSDCVRRCLACLYAQSPPPDEVIIVDASTDDHTQALMLDFPEVHYIRTDVGYGHMTKSRNLGLLHASGDILVFIDDDAFVHPGWLAHLLAPYDDPDVAAVGGLVRQGKNPPQPWVNVTKIGKLMPDGELYAGFDTHSGASIEVDHMMGCNMSFRQTAMAHLGGFRDDFPGTEVCEESDMSLRIRRIGYKIMYSPDAAVTHLGAPQFKGRRFDARYNFYSAHNNCLLLIRNYGLFSGIFFRFLISTASDRTCDLFRLTLRGPRAFISGLVRLTAYNFGLFLGVGVALTRRLQQGTSPIRKDAFAEQIRQHFTSIRQLREDLQVAEKR